MQFKANLFLTLLAGLVLVLLVNLGFWQLSRAQEKQSLLDLQAERINLPPVVVTSIDLSDEKLRYLPVKFNGEMDTRQQLLIDNQVKQGNVGYFVLTPVKLNNGQAILLNRGWLPLGKSRNDLPDIKVDVGANNYIGRLDKFPSVGIKLEGADELSAGWPAVTQVITPEKVAERLGYSVMPYQVLLNADEPNGYNRQWVPMKMGPEKHHGYAFQWFSLATAWVVIYFVLTVKFKRKEE